jgi:hypothetical protein
MLARPRFVRFIFRTVTSKRRQLKDQSLQTNTRSDTGIAMKKNAKQLDHAEGLRATIRSTAAKSPSQLHVDLLHERRLQLKEVRNVRTLHRS